MAVIGSVAAGSSLPSHPLFASIFFLLLILIRQALAICKRLLGNYVAERKELEKEKLTIKASKHNFSVVKRTNQQASPRFCTAFWEKC